MSSPLDDALPQAEHSSAAQRYTVPVDLVRTRIRRRRRIRTGVVAGVAALVVAAVVTPGTLGRSFVQTQATGDWPGQFSACGKPVQDVLETAGDISLSASLGPGSGQAIDLHTVTTGPADVGAWSYGLQVYVTDDDGTVVGVGEGPFVPPLDDLDSIGAASFTAGPFPLTDDRDVSLASCAQYPTGNGATTLRAGEYELVVVQTAGYVVGDGSDGETHARASTEVQLVVDPDGIPGPVATPRAAPTATAQADPDDATPSPDYDAMTPAQRAAALGPAAGLFWCGEPIGVTADTKPDSLDLTLKGSFDPMWHELLTADDETTATVPGAGRAALVGNDGKVVGFLVGHDDVSRQVTLSAGEPLGLDDDVHVVACDDMELDAFMAWPYAEVEVTATKGKKLDSPRTVVVIGDPLPAQKAQ